MRGDFPGYYQHSEEQLEALWKSAVVVPDTNVLLTLYRLGESTREKLLAILDGLGDRLFVPHQVAFEFQQSRLGVIDEQMKAYDDLDRELEKLSTSVLQTLRTHPRLDRAELSKQIESALKPIRDQIAAVKEDHPDPLDGGHALGADRVRDELDRILDTRVGGPRDFEKLKKVGAPRYERKQAPGWKDADKPERDRYGDLCIWLDAIDRVKADQKPLILITEERKEDWWWDWKGSLIGPCPELVEEVRDKAGQQFHLSNLSQFMEEGARALGLELSEEERDDVERVQQPEVVEHEQPPWVDLGQMQWFMPKAQMEFSDAQRQWLTDLNLQLYTPHFHWEAEVDVQGDRAELGLRSNQQIWVQSGDRRHHFVCVVSGPSGNRAQAVALRSELDVSFEYPRDFVGDLDQKPGEYKFRWHYSGRAVASFSIPSGEVAAGRFELGGPVSS
jgi:hypothetical protein